MATTPDQPTPGPPSEAEILADERLREPLAGYHPLHLDLFLKSYARLLADLHRNGEVYESNLEYLLHQHDKAAYPYLWLIQRQKLFDLECQWRAELVEVPGARLTGDFSDWMKYIEECRAVPPITPDELALLESYLAQLTDPRDLDRGTNLTFFHWMQKRHPHMRPDPDDPDDDEEPLSAWTQYWDLHRGTSYLRQLPDLRGDKEHRYEQAARDEHFRQHPSPEQPDDPRPHVPTWGPEHDELVRGYLRRFEPARRLRQFETKLQLEAYDASEDRLDLPLALERLQNAGPVLVPIEAHADWRQAIIEAGNRHYLGQLRAALPHLYEAYCEREQLGISHAPASDNRYHERGDSFRRQEEEIRAGRRLLGEPDDLDF